MARFVGGNDHFFLNLVMPAAKLQTLAAAGIPGSTVVTALARNGTDFGIQVAGTGAPWFTGPAGAVEGLYLGAYGPDDANPDIGDSAITETVGLGGFAMAGAPAIVRFVGGTVADALRTTRRCTRSPSPRTRRTPCRSSTSGRAHRHRRHPGGAHRHPAADQHRHRRPGRRHRPGRRRPGHPADGMLRRRPGRPG